MPLPQGLLSEGYTLCDEEGDGDGAGASSSAGEQVGVTCWRLSACRDRMSGVKCDQAVDVETLVLWLSVAL